MAFYKDGIDAVCVIFLTFAIDISNKYDKIYTLYHICHLNDGLHSC